jgi:hypothetical protein
MTKKKEQEVRFTFDDGDHVGVASGKDQCDICFGRYWMPEVAINLRDFYICPSCVLSGPAAVAAEAEKTIGDKKRLARWGEESDEPDGILKEYRLLARRLRRVKSFKEIPGGEVALAIATVTAPVRPRRRKAA